MNQRTTSSEAEPVADLTTDEIITAVLDGQGELYAEIIRRYQHSVLRIVTAMLYDRGASEDLVQQVFVNAYQHLDQFEPGRDFGAWIRTIARNAVREELRRVSRYDARLQVYGEVVAARWKDETAPEEYEFSLDESLETCLQHLSERATEVIRLRYHESWDFNQIAQALHSTSGAMRNILCRTLAQLRECIHRSQSAN